MAHFLDLEEPKSPTFSQDLSILLSEPNVPFPYQVGVHSKNELCKEKTGESRRLDASKHIPRSFPEKAVEVGTDQVSYADRDKRTVGLACSRRKFSHKTPGIDLNMLRVRTSELINSASTQMVSTSKHNASSNPEVKEDASGSVFSPPFPPSAQQEKNLLCSPDQSTGKRFDCVKSAGHAPFCPANSQSASIEDLSAKQGFKSTLNLLSTAIKASSVDSCATVDLLNSSTPTVDLASGNSCGNKSDLVRESQHSRDEQSKVYVHVNNEPYQVIRVMGEGGSSKVYEVFSRSLQLMAIKCVNLKAADKSICDSYLNEISVLSHLQGSDRVIKLYDHKFNEDEKMLYVVLERGDVDLATIITSNTKHKRITPEMVKFYWSEMLRAVEVIHKAGIIHSDLKPANFLLVAGQLKLIDFGIASTIPTDATSIIKDSRSGTPSYMSPEAFLDTREDGEGSLKIKIGVKSDVWSLGCILYHLVYKCTPFHHIRDPMKKMLSIVNPNHEITFQPLNDLHLIDVLKKCIVRDPKQRASISELLQHPYLTATSRLQHPLTSLMNSISELSPSSIQRISQVVGELKVKKK